MEKPFAAYSGDDDYIFVCYAHDDDEVVYSEITYLQENGVNIWYDEGVAPGEEWTEELALAINNAEYFLYFVSPTSVSSRHCRDELQFALNHTKKVVAVHLESTELPLGLELSIGATQAILRSELPADLYRQRLLQSVTGAAVLSQPTAVQTSPGKSSLPWAKAAIGLFGVLLLAGVIWFAYNASKNEPSPDPTALAVFPFENLGTDANLDRTGRALADDILSYLGAWDFPERASRTAAFEVSEQGISLQEIGQTLNVGYLLEGSIRDLDGRVRVTARLHRVADGVELWSAHYDRDLDALFQEHQSVADYIAYGSRTWLLRDLQKKGILSMVTSPAAARVLNRAVDLYTKLANGEGGSWQQLVDLYEETVEIEPEFWPGHLYLGNAYRHAVSLGISPNESSVLSHAAIEKCIAYVPDLGKSACLLQKAETYLLIDLDYSRAISVLEEILKINPQHIGALGFMAGSKIAQGQPREAFPLLERVLPSDWGTETLLSMIMTAPMLEAIGQNELAYTSYARGLKVAGQGELRSWMMRSLARLEIKRGNVTAAEDWLSQARALTGNLYPHLYVELYVLLGQTELAESEYGKWQLSGAKHARHIYNYNLYPSEEVRVHLAMGNLDAAIEMLRHAIDVREQSIVTRIRSNNLYDPYRADPRFIQLMQYLEEQEAEGRSKDIAAMELQKS